MWHLSSYVTVSFGTYAQYALPSHIQYGNVCVLMNIEYVPQCMNCLGKCTSQNCSLAEDVTSMY